MSSAENCLTLNVNLQIDEDLAKINIDDPKYQLRDKEGVLVNGVNSSEACLINNLLLRVVFMLMQMT